MKNQCLSIFNLLFKELPLDWILKILDLLRDLSFVSIECLLEVKLIPIDLLCDLLDTGLIGQAVSFS